MCHPVCFFQVPVQQSHPSIPLTSSVSTLYPPLFCIFYGLVKKKTKKKRPPIWFETFNEKIIWLKQITELCSMVLLFKKNWFIFRLVWFVLVLPFSFAPFSFFLLFLSCKNSPMWNLEKKTKKQDNLGHTHGTYMWALPSEVMCAACYPPMRQTKDSDHMQNLTLLLLPLLGDKSL